MQLRFFGKFADMLGRERMITLAQGTTVAELVGLIAEGDESIVTMLLHPSTTFVLDNVAVDKSTSINDGVEIGFLPPVSGG